MAHLYSYNQLGKTIAVLGNGFHHIFPEENVELYQKILDNGGLMISEYPPDTKCQSDYFLERNRIVSGLSLGILVVEALARSGTSVTSRLASLQNKKVFAIPHEIWNSHGIGTNRLIKNGAILVTDTADILQEFKPLRKMIKTLDTIDKVSLDCLDVDYHIFDTSNSPSNSISSSKSSVSDNKNLNFQFNSSTHPLSSCASSHVLQKKILKNSKLAYIYDLMSLNPMSINEVCEKTSTPISKVSSDLFALELEGYIKKVAGGYICILDK